MEQRILIIGPAWVGDMIMAQSLFMTLKRVKPRARIDVAAPPWTTPLLERMPEVDRAIPVPFRRGRLDWNARRLSARALRGENYDQAIVLPNSFKSALVPWLAGIPRRTGWRGEMRWGLLNDMRRSLERDFPLMLDRYNALAFGSELRSARDFPRPHPRPALVAKPLDVEATLEKFGLERDGPVLALCPGAEYGASKQWSPANYAAVAAGAAGRPRIWLLGSANDGAACRAVLSNLPPEARRRSVDLSGRTSLGEAIDLLSVADAVVSNDSGLLHAAAALGRRVVAVYGSSSPEHTPPLSERARVVRLPLACSPCFRRTCPLGHNRCMTELSHARVSAALSELVAAP